MTEQIINSKRGIFGRVQVTLPLNVKNSMISWLKKSGMGKAEFFRVALMIGAAQLASQVNAKNTNESYSDSVE